MYLKEEKRNHPLDRIFFPLKGQRFFGSISGLNMFSSEYVTRRNVFAPHRHSRIMNEDRYFEIHSIMCSILVRYVNIPRAKTKIIIFLFFVLYKTSSVSFFRHGTADGRLKKHLYWTLCVLISERYKCSSGVFLWRTKTDLFRFFRTSLLSGGNRAYVHIMCMYKN